MIFLNKTSNYSGGKIVAICSLAYFVSYFCRKDFSAVMAGMIEDGVITKQVAGYIGMALFVFCGLGQLVSGYLGDRFNPSHIILVGLCVTALSNLMMALVSSACLMILIWGLNGFAQAMLWPPIVRILSDNLEHERFVRANMCVTVAAHVSSILLYIYVPICLQTFSYKTVFCTAFVVGMIAMTEFAFAMHRVIFAKNYFEIPYPSLHKCDCTAEGEHKYISLVLKSGLPATLVSIMIVGILRDGIESWLPTLYSEAFGRDAAESVLLSVSLPIFAIISLCSITVLHKTKLFNNEVNGSIIIFAISFVLSAAILFFIGSESAVGRITCLILAAIVCSTMQAANFMLVSCLTGRYSRYGKTSTTSGITNSLTYVGAAVSMYAFPAISEKVGWSGTVFLWVVLSLIGAICLIAVAKKYARFIADDN